MSASIWIPAASEFYEDGQYVFRKSDKSHKSSDDMISLWTDWLKKYPALFSLEDGLAEDDWAGWKKLTSTLGGQVQLVADDIFVTNPEIFAKGIKEGVGNSILIKLNQIGTVTETLRCIEMAKAEQLHGCSVPSLRRNGRYDNRGLLCCHGRRSAEDRLSVCRGERIAKYNRLLEIEKELGRSAKYAGRSAYARWDK
jgi:enolase